MTTHINRGIVLLLLLVGLGACVLSIRSTNQKLDIVNTRLIGIEATVQAMTTTSRSFQTATTKNFDEMSKTITEQDRLISELERLLNSN